MVSKWDLTQAEMLRRAREKEILESAGQTPGENIRTTGTARCVRPVEDKDKEGA
jgi:hypothetical protein